MYSFGQPIFAPLPMGVTVPVKYPVMLLIVRVVCGCCLCLFVIVGDKHCLYL